MIDPDQDPFDGLDVEEMTRQTYRAGHGGCSLIRLFDRIQSDFDAFLKGKDLTGLAFLSNPTYSWGKEVLRLNYYVEKPDGKF